MKGTGKKVTLILGGVFHGALGRGGTFTSGKGDHNEGAYLNSNDFV